MKDLSNDAMVHKKGKEIEYLQFRKLLEYEELVHAYTLSKNGFDVGSNDTYEDSKKRIYDNYEKLAKELQIDINTIIKPYQTHTSMVKCIKEKPDKITISPKELTNVDGLVTNQKEITFLLSFADCTPIYLYDPVKKVIGDIHSGWKGTLEGIGRVAIRTMIHEYDCNPHDIICCFGPHIKKCHFEVGEEVANAFKTKYTDMKQIDEIVVYTGEKEGAKKYHIDTQKINENIMLEMGLLKENIIDSGICSVCESTYMHSYRAQGKSAGRNTAVLGMKK